MNMKNPLYIFSFAVVVLAAGCKDNEVAVTPSAISNARYEERPGGIFLKWDLPSDNSVLYVKAMYHDPLLDIDAVRLSSCDSILIPDTRAKYGDYFFTLQPFSSTDTGGAPLSITARSGPATAGFGQANQMELTLEDLSTNAQEPTEGPIANLLDGDTATFFHSAWSEDIPAPHWLQVRLPDPVDNTGFFRFYYAPRNNDRQKPTDFDLMGSTDGEDWTLIRNFTQSGDGLPVTASDTYTSPNLRPEFTVNYIRIVVNKVNTGENFFTMSEFRVWSGPMIDPEAE